jgi:hypothetical protein
MKRLLIARFRGGDARSADPSDVVWTSEGPTWDAVVPCRASAKYAAKDTGAELLSCEEWDGSPFDGVGGTIMSPKPGVIVGPRFVRGMIGYLPSGWGYRPSDADAEDQLMARLTAAKVAAQRCQCGSCCDRFGRPDPCKAWIYYRRLRRELFTERQIARRVEEELKKRTADAHPLRQEWIQRGHAMIDYNVSKEGRRDWCRYLMPWRAPDGTCHTTRDEALATIFDDTQELYGSTSVVFDGTDVPPAPRLPPLKAAD